MVLPVRLGKAGDSIQPTSRNYIWRIVKDVSKRGLTTLLMV